VEVRKMSDDAIVAEVRRARMEILESYGGDYREMMRDMMKKQWSSGRKLVCRGANGLPDRPLEPAVRRER
jgi:hypothetical protein